MGVINIGSFRSKGMNCSDKDALRAFAKESNWEELRGACQGSEWDGIMKGKEFPEYQADLDRFADELEPEEGA